MSKSYPKAKVSEICDFIRGVTFTPKDLVSPGTDKAIACFRTKNVQQELDLSDVIYIPLSFVKNKSQILANGDILISNANSKDIVGKCCYVDNLDFPATLGGFIAAVRAKSDKVNSRYLYYWMNSPVTQAKFRLLARQTTNIANLPMSLVGQVELPLPPLAEQERIVCLLDEAEALRKLRGQASAHMKEFVPALFHDMFGDPVSNPMGWPTSQLGEVIMEGPQNGLYKHSSFYGSGTPILRIDGFYDGVVTGVSKLKRVNATSDEVQKYKLQIGDLVINRVNSPEYLGKSALIEQLPEITLFESNMMRFVVDVGKLVPMFLIQFLQTRYMKQQILARAKHAINQSSINQEDIKLFRVYIPPLALQHEFAQRVQEARDVQSVQMRSEERIEALYQSMLSRAFAGEL